MSSLRSLVVSLALTLILVGVSSAFGVFDCCKRHTEKKFKVSQVLGLFEGYYHQHSARVCDIDAIVFTVNTKPCGEPDIVKLCADPKQKWVKNMISALNKQTIKSKKRQQRKRQKLCTRKKKKYV